MRQPVGARWPGLHRASVLSVSLDVGSSQSRPSHLGFQLGLRLTRGGQGRTEHHLRFTVGEAEAQRGHVLPGWVQLVPGAAHYSGSATRGSGSHLWVCARIPGSSSAWGSPLSGWVWEACPRACPQQGDGGPVISAHTGLCRGPELSLHL